MPDIGNVDDRLSIMEKYAKFYEDMASYDVILDVEGQKIQAHRLVLAVHSKFFRILMLGRCFKEANDDEIKLEVPVEAFKIVLSYMYTGKVDLRQFPLQQVTELLEISHRYELLDLEKACVRYLCLVVDAENACEILRIAILLEKVELQERCEFLICLTIEGIFQNELDLSFEMFQRIIEEYNNPGRNEANWFKAVQKLTSTQGFCSEEQKKDLLDVIELNEMTMKQLIKIVKPSKYVDEVGICQLIESLSLYETRLSYDTNMISKNASMIKGKNSNYIFTTGSGYAFHDLEAGDGMVDCIVVDLGALHNFNSIKMFLPNWVMYSIKTSKNDNDWLPVINFSNCLCKGLQNVNFPEVVGKYIKIVGYPESKNQKKFICNSFEVMLISKPPLHFEGFLVPSENVALLDKADVFLYDHPKLQKLETAILSESIVENGINTQFVAALVNQASIRVYLKQPHLISSCRFKLWDHDERKYSYRVLVTTDFTNITLVSDKSEELLSGWQTIRFSPQKIGVFIIDGIKASKGNEIRIVQFQAPAPEEST